MAELPVCCPHFNCYQVAMKHKGSRGVQVNSTGKEAEAINYSFVSSYTAEHLDSNSKEKDSTELHYSVVIEKLCNICTAKQDRNRKKLH